MSQVANMRVTRVSAPRVLPRQGGQVVEALGTWAAADGAAWLLLAGARRGRDVPDAAAAPAADAARCRGCRQFIHAIQGMRGVRRGPGAAQAVASPCSESTA